VFWRNKLPSSSGLKLVGQGIGCVVQVSLHGRRSLRLVERDEESRAQSGSEQEVSSKMSPFKVTVLFFNCMGRIKV
jgi:hypothetical protein